MNIHVNADHCTGCGACMEVCPAGAIHLDDNIAHVDQDACTQCLACIDACPAGAIAAVEKPVQVQEPAFVQTVSAPVSVLIEPPGPGSKPWLSATLAAASREILPRIIDGLIAALDRWLSSATPVGSQAYLPYRSAEFPAATHGGRGRRRRNRFGRDRRRGRGSWQG